MKKLLLGLPCGHRGLDPRSAVSLMHLTSALAKLGVAWSVASPFNNPDIANTHNEILEEFLRSDAERLLIVDNDIVFNARAATLITAGVTEDFVAGSYMTKGADPRPAWSVAVGGARNGELVEAAVAPTGFTSLSRAVVELIAEGVPTYDEHGKDVHAFMSTGPGIDGRWWSSDEWLCRRWQRHGKCWVDTRAKVGHVGSKVF